MENLLHKLQLKGAFSCVIFFYYVYENIVFSIFLLFYWNAYIKTIDWVLGHTGSPIGHFSFIYFLILIKSQRSAIGLKIKTHFGRGKIYNTTKINLSFFWRSKIKFQPSFSVLEVIWLLFAPEKVKLVFSKHVTLAFFMVYLRSLFPWYCVLYQFKNACLWKINN